MDVSASGGIRKVSFYGLHLGEIWRSVTAAYAQGKYLSADFRKAIEHLLSGIELHMPWPGACFKLDCKLRMFNHLSFIIDGQQVYAVSSKVACQNPIPLDA